jgi:AraC family transcriptional regulator
MEQAALSFSERLDRLVEGFLEQASSRPRGPEIANRAAYSLAQTHRIFRRAYGESPGAFRRRLMLERAAEMLRAGLPVWKAGIEAGYASPEGFSRAFRKAYRTSPESFRKAAAELGVSWLPAPNRVHYWRGSLLRSMDPGGKQMNIVERLVEHDLSDTRRLLERAATLTNEQLDAKGPDPQPRLFLECFEPTIRGRLDYLVLTKECWLAAVHGRPNPLEGGSGSDGSDQDRIRGSNRSPAGLLERWSKLESEWRELVAGVEREGRWNEQFIDALCEQPVTFSFGGMIAHVLDQAARQRAELFRAFTALGHEDVCDGDPLSWEQKRAG